MNRSRALRTRQSAGTMSPADKATRSPATRPRTGSSWWARGRPLSAPAGNAPGPRRITLAVLVTSARRPSAARCERPSCTKRITVLSSTITAMTTVALASALTKDSSASKVSSRVERVEVAAPQPQPAGAVAAGAAPRWARRGPGGGRPSAVSRPSGCDCNWARACAGVPWAASSNAWPSTGTGAGCSAVNAPSNGRRSKWRWARLRRKKLLKPWVRSLSIAACRAGGCCHPRPTGLRRAGRTHRAPAHRRA